MKEPLFWMEKNLDSFFKKLNSFWQTFISFLGLPILVLRSIGKMIGLI